MREVKKVSVDIVEWHMLYLIIVLRILPCLFDRFLEMVNAINRICLNCDTPFSQKGSDSAERITDQILETVEHLERYPHLGSLHPDPVLASMEYRRIVSGNYVCVYRVIDDTVVIYRIVNGRTDYPRIFYPS